MSKHLSKKRRLKYVLLALTCTATFAASGLAACAPEEGDPTEDNKKTTREDTQLLKNGNFEFYDVPEKEKDGNEPVYLINTPNNWSHMGTSSSAMSGIINTSKSAWETMSDEKLKDKLDANNELDKDDADYKELYVDYNGMKSSDILYRDTYAALNSSRIENQEEYFGITSEGGKYYYKGKEVFAQTGDNDSKTFFLDTDHTKPLTEERIANPLTHYDIKSDSNGSYYLDEKGNRVNVVVDEKGDYYLNHDETNGYTGTLSSILMLHNYSDAAHNGIAQSYSSVTVDLPANTAAEISVWVKTQDLLYHGGENVTQDRGAYITVSHSVGSTSLDNFTISSINTQKLLGDSQENNGWVQYTVYVKSCDFADSSVSLILGLGENDKPVEGYAFFDDLTVKQFANINDENCTYGDNKAEIETDYVMLKGVDGEKDTTRKAIASLESDESEKIFQADVYKRNNKTISDRFSNCYHYLLDLASGREYDKYTYANGVTAGLTVDDNDYVCSTDYSFGNNVGADIKYETAGKVKLPDDLKNLTAGINTSADFIALTAVNDNNKLTSAQTAYYEKLNEALITARHLPNADDNTKSLVMLSARGAAYTSSFEFTVAKGSYNIISFWLKTSDMEGATAATVKLTDVDNDDTTTNITLDTTNVVTDLNDAEDIYNGWVQCFFFVHNEDNSDDGAKTLKFEFSFGNTTISGTDVSSYKAGWAAITNVQSLTDIDEDKFSLTSAGDHSASLEIPENPKKNTNAFADVYGNQSNEIKENIVKPSSYSGVNGGSSKIVNNGAISHPFDSIDTNSYAGLINKDNVSTYYNKDWYGELTASFGVDKNAVSAQESWNKVFNEKAYQPLIIINKLRKYAESVTADEDNYTKYYIEANDGDIVGYDGKTYRKATSSDGYDKETNYYTLKDVLNYGYVGSNASVSSNSYSAVSVRVKVSAGAVAYVYLTDTAAGNKVLDFDTPSYSFWYDVDGNVLKGEIDEDASLADRKANVLYSLRTDGLYEDTEGKLYANTWNYTKLYKDQSKHYYDENGKEVSFEDLVGGETYYASATDKSIMANHFLVTTSGTKVYEYKDGNYYYIVNGKTQDSVVNPFDKSYARYTDVNGTYTVCIDARYDANGKYFTEEGCGALGYDKDGKKVADKWITVTFVIHAGSETKNYRIELWSGSRENTGVDAEGATEFKQGSSVLFDYSYTSVSNDDLNTYYENQIIKAYQKLLIENGVTEFESSSENISYYEKLAKDNNITVTGDILNSYKAHYYTYSLYDSANYQPFNADVADETATGYDYNLSDYSETLTYLEVKEDDAYTVFTDYATVDQDIKLGAAEDKEEEETEDEKDSNIWLLISSILLVIALVFAMIAILVRDKLKKLRRTKVTGKNNYDHNKVNRYMRKLKINKEEIEEVDTPAVENEDVEQPVEEVEEAEQPAEEVEQEVEQISEETEADEPENKDE